jgi:NADP-reducing hydrogenase subunit HndD
MDCPTCPRSGNCELLQLAAEFGIDAVRYAGEGLKPQIEASALHLVRDNSKCILCRRCTAVCRKVQEVGVIGPNNRGFDTHIGCAFDRDLAEVDCVLRHASSPVPRALYEKEIPPEYGPRWPIRTSMWWLVPAPAIRVTWGMLRQCLIGTNVEGKMVTALRRLGFVRVFDVETPPTSPSWKRAPNFSTGCRRAARCRSSPLVPPAGSATANSMRPT